MRQVRRRPCDEKSVETLWRLMGAVREQVKEAEEAEEAEALWTEVDTQMRKVAQVARRLKIKVRDAAPRPRAARATPASPALRRREVGAVPTTRRSARGARVRGRGGP